MPFRATNTFQQCTSQGSCWSPGSRPGPDHKRKLFAHWSCRWPGVARAPRHCRVWALQGFPALPSALSPAGPAANIPSDNGPAGKGRQLPPALLHVSRKARSAMFTQSPSRWPGGLPETHLGFFPPRKRVFSSSTVGRSHISLWHPGLKGGRRPRGGRSVTHLA